MYFVSTLYFCALEPKLKFFERRWVKLTHGVIVLLTCAFTLSLFMQSATPFLKPFANESTAIIIIGLFIVIVLFAIIASANVKLMTQLSQFSVALFILLMITVALVSKFSVHHAIDAIGNINDYFTHLPEFFLPFNAYHEFYIAWWMTWTIMLGQFVAKFVKQLSPWKLLFIMVILPLLPTAIWFSILFHWQQVNIEPSLLFNGTMVFIAMLFVINSLDFMTANYGKALGLNRHQFPPTRRGNYQFITINTLVLFIVTYLFHSQLLLVNYIALLVIGLIVILLISSTAATQRLKQQTQ